MLYGPCSKCFVSWHQIRECFHRCLCFAYTHTYVLLCFASTVCRTLVLIWRTLTRVLLTPRPCEGPLLKHERKGSGRGAYALLFLDLFSACMISTQKLLPKTGSFWFISLPCSAHLGWVNQFKVRFRFMSKFNRRKFRSQTSDNMERWKSKGVKSPGGEDK